MFIKNSLFLSMILVLISCGKVESLKDKKLEISINSLNEYTQHIESIYLDQNVPEGLGQLLIKKQTENGISVSTCSWFLIDDNMAITNSNCIPKQLKQTDCSKYLGGAFMSSLGVEKRLCKRILDLPITIENNSFVDKFSLIELDRPVDAKPFKLDRSGISEGDVLTIHSMNSTKTKDNKIVGIYSQKQCVAKKSFYYGNFENAMSLMVPIFSDEESRCDLNEIDQSSAITDDKGALKGIVFSYQESPLEFNSSLYDTTLVKKVALATNFACTFFNDEKLDAGRSDECDELLVKDNGIRKLRIDSIKDQIKQVIFNKIQLLKVSFPKSFKYEIKIDEITDTTDVGVTISPKCILPEESWPESEQAKLETYGLFWLNKRYKTQIPIYRAKVLVSFDEFAKYLLNVNLSEVGKTLIHIENFDKLSDSTQVVVKASQLIFNSKLEISYKLPLCK